MQTESIVAGLEAEMDREVPRSARLTELTTELLSSWEGPDALPKGIAHPLGFMYVPLKKHNGRALRLHMWDSHQQRKEPKTSPYHAHSWILRSHVLAGAVTNHLPSIFCSYTEAQYRLHDIGGDSTIDVIEPTSVTVKLLPGAQERYNAGESYSMPSGEFHTTHCDAGTYAATLCLVENVPGGSEITLGPLEPASITDSRQPAEPSTLRQVLARLRSELEARTYSQSAN